MAAIDGTFVGEFYDKVTRTYYSSATMVGQFFLTGLGVGGGPLPGRPGGGGGEGIWGPTDPRPTPPIHLPGGGGEGIWGPTDPRPTPPIFIPPNVPPSVKPPEPPNPGDPTTAVPGNWPVSPVPPPPYLVVQYPGIGPVVVAPPLTAQPKG